MKLEHLFTLSDIHELSMLIGEDPERMFSARSMARSLHLEVTGGPIEIQELRTYMREAALPI